MKVPNRIQPLVEDGLIDEVISRLMSGKEATVYVVRCGDEIRCAKVYKDAAQRSFKNAVQYQEGRKVKNSRRSRAMEKGSKYGRSQQEAAWHNTEVDALKKLLEAGVRVPETFGCIDGVLIMELITDEQGHVAPRLDDVSMDAEQAIEDHHVMMHYIVKMLSVGLIHGDLSEFNVLVDEYGPVIIDLPQVVDASGNNNAQWMLTRDVDKITDYYAQFAPELKQTKYAKEIWALYQSGDLTADSELTGLFVEDETNANVDDVLAEIQAAIAEEESRLERIRSANEDDD
ncbi:PA4780 family RIO1-like protein kinase [Marinomonas algicola]|uniref:PA4780 family RIO1-like protein kinase n=1 Tax=Marinomonas algicola TaxID=2773454 RepID=UPI00174C9B4C|nr:PA4780 family RIO1-like protein kinase [Marinomonas algicola]